VSEWERNKKIIDGRYDGNEKFNEYWKNQKSEVKMDYSVIDNYTGNNKKVKKAIKLWESMTYNEKHELFMELDEWSHHGY